MSEGTPVIPAHLSTCFTYISAPWYGQKIFAAKDGLSDGLVSKVVKGSDAPPHGCYFTEYLVNAPPAWTSEFGPSAAYTLPSASTATPSPAVP